MIEIDAEENQADWLREIDSEEKLLREVVDKAEQYVDSLEEESNDD